MDGVLPFLDVCVMRGNNDRPNFKIYRKPTHSNMYVHCFSNHSDNVKLSAISSLFLRAYRLCDSEYIDSEVIFIKNTFLSLGYKNFFIDRALFRARRTFYQSHESGEKPEYNEFVILPSFIDNVHINKLFPPNVRIVYSGGNSIKTFLRNPATKGIGSNAGVYSIPCSDCNLKYIGETDNFERRMREHRNDIRTERINNPIVKHIVEDSHQINVNNSTLIKKCLDVRHRKLVESFVIYNVPNINIYQCSFNFDDVLSDIFKANINHLNKILISLLDNG